MMDTIFDDIQAVLKAEAGQYLDLNCGILKQVTQKDIRAVAILSGLIAAAHGMVANQWLLLVASLVVNQAVEQCQGWENESVIDPISLFSDVLETVPLESAGKLVLSFTSTTENTYSDLCRQYVIITRMFASYESGETLYGMAGFRAVTAYFHRVKWWMDTITGCGRIHAN